MAGARLDGAGGVSLSYLAIGAYIFLPKCLICVKEHQALVSSCASTENGAFLMNLGLKHLLCVWGDMKAQGGEKTSRCLWKLGARARPSKETRPPADHASLCSILYPNFSLLRGLSGVCLNYSDMNSQSENVHSFERSSTSDFCVWYAGAYPFNSPFLNEILVSKCLAQDLRKPSAVEIVFC